MRRILLVLALILCLLLSSCSKTTPASEMTYQGYSYDIGYSSLINNITETATTYDPGPLRGGLVVQTVSGYTHFLKTISEERSIYSEQPEFAVEYTPWTEVYSNLELDFEEPAKYYEYFEKYSLAIVDCSFPSMFSVDMKLVSQKIAGNTIYINCTADYDDRGSLGMIHNIGYCFLIPVPKTVTNAIIEVDWNYIGNTEVTTPDGDYIAY